jgi:hypothetical protein
MAVDRVDPNVAAGILGELCPDVNARRSWARYALQSVGIARSISANSWEITLFSHGVRLNVGQVAVLELWPGVAVFYCCAPVPIEPSKDLQRQKDWLGYRAVKAETERWRVDVHALPRVPPRLVEKHLELVRLAALGKRASPFRAAHSPGVFTYLEGLASDAELERQPALPDDKPVAIYDICVYAIRRADALDEDWRQGGVLSFTEGKSWTRAAKELAAAKRTGVVLPIVFADACGTNHLIFRAQIDDVHLLSRGRKAQTRIVASRLEKLASPPLKTELVIADTGRRIPAGHIRSYVICRTPQWLYARDVVSPQAPPEMLDLPEPGTEGRRKLVQHLIRERNRAVVEEKKRSVLQSTASLACEVCGFDFHQHYGTLGHGFCEVHHLLALCDASSEVQTKLEDLAVVCANCHRVIHRGGEARELATVRAALRHP